MQHLDPEDVVVAELDVLVSNELAALHSQLVMLQQPLRPNWRPYDTDRSGATARFKPGARRLEMELPLDTKGENYAAPAAGDEGGSGALKALALRSSPVDDSGNSFAVGVVRGGALVLMPLDYSLQLRPNMAFLSAAQGDAAAAAGGSGRRGGAAAAAAAAAAAGDDSDEDGEDEQATAVEVTVKRRETERQQQARLRSYSYLQQEEEQEAWLPLALHQEGSRPADLLWHKMLTAAEAAEAAAADAAAAAAAGGDAAAAAAAAQQEKQQRQMPQPLSRQEYLNAFVPSRNPAAGTAAAALGDGGGGDTSAAAAAAAAAADGEGGGELPLLLGHPNDVATPEMAAAVGPVVKALVTRHGVVSMANVRQWLQQQAGEPSPLVRAAAMLSDPVLHGLLTGCGHVTAIRRSYVAKVGGNAATEPLRQVVVRLLMDKATLRKADVMAAAEAAGLANPSESQYQRVMKGLCRNNGNHWTIKTSADM